MSIPLSIYADRPSVGRAAAAHVMSILAKTLAEKGSARVIFACAPSQDQFLESLVELSIDRVEWQKVIAFHMDEYIGLSATHPASFRHYLQTHFLSHVQIGAFHPIAGEAPEPERECARYAALVQHAPIDLICLGIGENGHLAFNGSARCKF